MTRCSRDMSGLIAYGWDKLLLLERVFVTSEILTRIGLGRELPGEYFPNLKQSLTKFGPIELLMLESTLAAS